MNGAVQDWHQRGAHVAGHDYIELHVAGAKFVKLKTQAIPDPCTVLYLVTTLYNSPDQSNGFCERISICQFLKLTE